MVLSGDAAITKLNRKLQNCQWEGHCAGAPAWRCAGVQIGIVLALSRMPLAQDSHIPENE